MEGCAVRLVCALDDIGGLDQVEGWQEAAQVLAADLLGRPSIQARYDNHGLAPNVLR